MVTSRCSYFWKILQRFRAIEDSLFHIYVLLFPEWEINFLCLWWACDLKIFSFGYDVHFANSGQAERPLGWTETWHREVPTVSLSGKFCVSHPVQGPLLGRWRNCLTILGLASSVLASLRAVWLLEKSLSLTVTPLPSLKPWDSAGLRKSAVRNNQTEIFSWALHTVQILNDDKGAASNFRAAF